MFEYATYNNTLFVSEITSEKKAVMMLEREKGEGERKSRR